MEVPISKSRNSSSMVAIASAMTVTVIWAAALASGQPDTRIPVLSQFSPQNGQTSPPGMNLNPAITLGMQPDLDCTWYGYVDDLVQANGTTQSECFQLTFSATTYYRSGSIKHLSASTYYFLQDYFDSADNAAACYVACFGDLVSPTPSPIVHPTPATSPDTGAVPAFVTPTSPAPVTKAIPRSRPRKLSVAVAAGAAGGVGALLGLFFSLVLLWRLLSRNGEKERKEMATSKGDLELQSKLSSGDLPSIDNSSYSLKISDKAVRSYTFDEVVNLTNNWKLELGKGISSIVYFGEIYEDHDKKQDPQRVAVKKLNLEYQQGKDDFLKKALFISKIHHDKLVSLVGYCEEPIQMLIYDYVEEGTLDRWLHGSEEGAPTLDWTRRLQIALDAAVGLDYLHTCSLPSILHRDVTSSNILLTKEWRGRVADFAVSKLGSGIEDKENISTIVKQKIDYLDPEYFGSTILTNKSDVYSFGIVLLEIVTGRKPKDSTIVNHGHRNIAKFVEKNYPKRIKHIVDPKLKSDYNINSVRKIVHVALRSLAVFGLNRPSMTEVVAEIRAAIKLEKQPAEKESTEGDSGANPNLALEGTSGIDLGQFSTGATSLASKPDSAYFSSSTPDNLPTIPESHTASSEPVWDF